MREATEDETQGGHRLLRFSLITADISGAVPIQATSSMV
jgi:hypothetical protein